MTKCRSLGDFARNAPDEYREAIRRGRRANSITHEQVEAVTTELSDGAAHDLVIQSLDARVVPVTRIPDVLREWREPRHSEFREGRTAWRLFNAFTESLKGRLDALPTRT
jgi:hypothetical protein